ncbi:MAG: DUF2188 domain-containing protein [Candidatus Pacebacteria bacterium]|nr:DUF2188 domain-containing protein [Candidatus Paceibacterota bacterium]
MAKKNIHTVPQGDRWAVKEEGKSNPISTHSKKVLAERRAITEAKQREVEHVIHGRNGRIQDKDSYGKDPNPPRDKKH